MKTRFDIIHSIVGGAMSGSPDGIDIDFKDGQTMPSEEQIAEKQAEYDAKAYARTRATAYPADADFKEAYTEKEIGGDSTKWDAYVTAYNKVRTDNPK